MRYLFASLLAVFVFVTPAKAQDFCLDLCVDCMITATDALAALNAAVGLNPEMCMPSTTVTLPGSTTTSTTTTAPPTTTSSTTTTTMVAEDTCETELCAGDPDRAQRCATFVEECLAATQEGDEDECIAGGLFICEGGACGQDLCAEDMELSDQCQATLDACLMAATSQPDVEACVAAGILTCGAGICRQDQCAFDDTKAQECQMFLDDCLMQAETSSDQEACVAAALFKCEAVGECTEDADCQDESFCNGVERCGVGAECEEAIGDPCGPGEICVEESGECIEEP